MSSIARIKLHAGRRRGFSGVRNDDALLPRKEKAANLIGPRLARVASNGIPVDDAASPYASLRFVLA